MFLEYYFKHNACLLSLNVTQKKKAWQKNQESMGLLQGPPTFQSNRPEIPDLRETL